MSSGSSSNSRGSKSLAGVATDLGIVESALRRWKRELEQHGTKAFGGQGVARDEELMRLRRELAHVKKERDFLRTAAVYFAQDGK